jgi:hypothetical protein
MFARKDFVSHLGRAAMIAGVAATVLTSVGPSVAFAAPAAKEKGLTAAGTSGATDFSAQRRYYRGGYYRGGGAAAAAAFAGIVGTGLAIAASRPYYDDSYAYYGGPAYYPAPTYYYGGDPAYYGGYGYYGGYRSGVPTYRGHPLASW